MSDTPLLTSQMHKALKLRHAQDIYIDEFACHVGNKYFLMDGWTTPYGYDKHFTGYEIKASRQDFLRDKKWQNYLDFCHNFYFVCPVGLISADEIPDSVGLMFYNHETDKVRIKKRAKITDCKFTEKTWKYIMMQFARRRA